MADESDDDFFDALDTFQAATYQQSIKKQSSQTHLNAVMEASQEAEESKE